MKSSKSPSVLARGSRWVAPLLIVVGIVIGVTLIWGVLVSLERIAKDSVPKPPKNWAAPTEEEVLKDRAEEQSKKVELSALLSDVYKKARERKDFPVLKDQLPVNWIEAKEIPYRVWGDVFGGVMTAEQVLQMSTSTPRNEQEYYRPWGDRLWRVGTIAEGALAGGSVYVMKINADFPFQKYSLEFVKSADGKRLVVVERSIVEQDAVETAREIGLLVEDKAVQLQGGEFPTRLSLAGHPFLLSSSVILGSVFDEANPIIDLTGLSYVTTTSEGVELYANTYIEDASHFMGDGCLLAMRADGSWMKYSAFLSAYSADEAVKSSFGGERRIQIPGIKWNKEFENSNEYYGVSMSGCGMGYCSDLARLSKEEETDLIQVGTDRVSNDPVFTFKHPLESSVIKGFYDMWYVPSEEKKPSLEDMMNRYIVPVFFWKDPIGRWNRYTVSGLMPQAECGKPVIYLYPATSTQVSVKLPNFINVTVSDPQYPVNGWNVLANSNGDLVSRDDGKMYGSLYWEGTGVGYQVPKTGFIVKDGEVSSFLTAILPKYGLNQKEMKEFMDFWVPRMTGAPYYQISFLTSEWSKVAPLNVTPRPQTNIRIFMDWKPLSRSKSIKAPTIVTPARNGFTLVEWGGLLYK